MRASGQRADGQIRLLPGDRFTPTSLAIKLRAKAILESSSFVKGRERYSILLVREAFQAEQRADGVWLHLPSGSRRMESLPAAGGRPAKASGFDILDALAYFAEQQPPLRQDLPCPSGGVGFLSWEFASRCDAMPMRPRDVPPVEGEARFILGHVFAIFDHYTDIIYLVGVNYNEAEIDLNKALDEVERRMNDLDFTHLSSNEGRHDAQIVQGADDRQAYIAGVNEIKKEIEAGNLLQCVLSRRVTVKTDLSPIQAYRNLRTANPAPYLFYLDYGPFQILGASPEVHVKAKDGIAEIKPIAGTRRRGVNSMEDEALEAELKDDEKEKAEHLMLVDLARNDLGRVCKPGTVKLTDFMEVERYSQVMHLVSRVEGQLREGVDAAALIRASFPAGTVSGAPKIRAVETLDALENQARGFYAGLVGYFEAGGNMDSCITIRSALAREGHFTLQAGAGIVQDSVSEREYEETCQKLRALTRAIGAEA